MKENNGLDNVLNKNTSNINKISSILDVIKDNDDFDSILALVLILEKEINNFESKDIISKSMSKPYAILSCTNQVQKDIINEIISKQNDNKGQTKKMYFDIINNTLKAIKQNSNENEKSGFFSRFKRS